MAEGRVPRADVLCCTVLCFAVSFFPVGVTNGLLNGTFISSAPLRVIIKTLRRPSPSAPKRSRCHRPAYKRILRRNRGGPGRSRVGDERIPGQKGGRPEHCEGGVRANGCGYGVSFLIIFSVVYWAAATFLSVPSLVMSCAHDEGTGAPEGARENWNSWYEWRSYRKGKSDVLNLSISHYGTPSQLFYPWLIN